jgi:hypothetical protein
MRRLTVVAFALLAVGLKGIQMRRLLLVAVLACVLAFAASASASPDQVLHFSVTYPGGVAHCTGNRITHTTSGKTFIKDVETCIVNGDWNPLPPGTWDVNSPTIGGWCSDVDGAIFDISTCNLATSGHVTVTDNGDGTFTWDIVAYYAQP